MDPTSTTQGTDGLPTVRRARNGLRLLTAALVAGLSLLALAVASLQIPAVGTRVATFLLGKVAPLPGATIAVREARGDWLTRLELRGLSLVRGDTTLASVGRVRVLLNPWGLLGGRIDVPALEFEKFRVAPALLAASSGTGRREEAPTNPAVWLRGRFYSGPEVRVGRLDVREGRYGESDDSNAAGPRLAQVALRAHDLRLGGEFRFVLDSLSFRLSPSGRPDEIVDLRLAALLDARRFRVEGLRLRGPRTVVDGAAAVSFGSNDSIRQVALELRASRLDLEELSWIVPSLDAAGEAAGSVTLRGPSLERLTGSIRGELPSGRVAGFWVTSSWVDAAVADGNGTLSASIGCEGGLVTARGWVRPLGAASEFEFDVRSDRLPRRLPRVPWWEAFARRVDLVSQWRIAGREGFAGRIEVSGEATDGEGRIAMSGSVRGGMAPEWAISTLTVRNLDAARWAGNSESSDWNGSLRARGRGATPESLDATLEWTIGQSRHGAWRIRDGEGAVSIAAYRARARGRIATDQGAIEAEEITASLGPGIAVHAPAIRLTGIDLAAVTGNPEMASDLGGTAAFDVALAPQSGHATAPSGHGTSASGTIVLEPSRLMGRALEGGEARFRWEHDRLDLETTIRTDAGRLDLSAMTRPFAEDAELTLRSFRFEDLDLAAWNAAAPTSRLGGDLSGTARWMNAAGTSDGGGDRRSIRSWSGTLSLDPSRIGSVTVASGRIRGEGAGDSLHARGELRAPSGRAVLAADAALGERPSGVIRATVPFGTLAGLAGHDSLEATGDIRAEVTFRGTDPADALVAGRVEGQGSIGGWRIDSLLAVARLDAGAVDVETAVLRSTALDADASGRLAVLDSAAVSDFRLRAVTGDLESVRPLLGAENLSLEEGRLEMRLTGPAAARAIDADGILRSLVWDNLRLSHAEADAHGVWDAHGAGSTVQGTVRVSRVRRGNWPMDQATVRAELRGAELVVSADARFDPTHQLRARAVATRDSSEALVRLDALTLLSDSRSWRLVRPASLHVASERLGIDSLELRADRGRLLADGVLDRRGAQRFQLEAADVDLGLLDAWLGENDVNGRFDARLAVDGPADAPRVGGFARLRAGASGSEASTAELRLDWEGETARLAASIIAPGGDSLMAKARLPLALSLAPPEAGRPPSPVRVVGGDVDVRVLADRFPLASLDPLVPTHVVSELRGWLDADLRLAGRGEALQGDGHIGIRDGLLSLPSLGTTYRDIRADGVLTGNRIDWRDTSARSEGGSLTLEGGIGFHSLTRIEPDLRLIPREFVFVNTSDLRLMASGDVRIGGELAAPRITGQITGGGCAYDLSAAVAAGSAAAGDVTLTPEDVRMLEEHFGVQGAADAVSTGALYDALDIDVAVTLLRDNWVRMRQSPRFSVALSGACRVRKPPHGELDLRGEITAVPGRGYIEQFGRTFDVVGGEIRMDGPVLEHHTEIRTEYRAPAAGSAGAEEVVVHLDVKGTGREWNLALYSEPALEEGEILAYITTGQSAKGAGGGSGAGALARDAGLAHVTGALQEIAQQKVGLDVLRVRYDPHLGATVVAGRYLGPKVFVGLQQPVQFRATGERDSQNPYQTAAEIEYEAAPWLIMNLQGEVSVFRAFLRARHGY